MTVLEAHPALVLRAEDGEVVVMDVARWHGHPTPEEQDVLGRLAGPVLDVGCGPGRHTLALAERGVPALGVDASPVAVDLARRRGAMALERSVFEPLPGTGRWGAALLLDGNIGIGGCPDQLLARMAELLRPGGRAVVEVGRPGSGTRQLRARLERGNETGPWFPWALVDAEAIGDLGRRAGLTLVELTDAAGRWFAWLTPAPRTLAA